MASDTWALGDAYEAYVGRWSRLVARAFLRRLAVPAGRRWLDVGCGTGALTSEVVGAVEPAHVVGVDPSLGFLTSARAVIGDSAAALCAGDARRLPLPDGSRDVVVSGLALNFVPEPSRAVAEMRRVTAPGGVVATYVWDYAGGMQMMRYFWDAAVTVDPAAAELSEGSRFAMCRPDPLGRLWSEAGLDEVHVEALDVPTVFADFDDYWTPFLGGQGPAPSYVATLDEERRGALRDLLRDRLPVDPDGRIPLTARAWMVRGEVPGGAVHGPEVTSGGDQRS